MPSSPQRTAPGRLGFADLGRLGAAGLRTRPLRAVLSAVGIAIGIAAMLAVVGVATSSRADLDRTLDRLGTNLLTVGPGENTFGDASQLPVEAVTMVRRIGPVLSVSAVGRIDRNIYRNDHVPAGRSGSIAVLAAQLDLPGTIGATVARGSWLNAATDRFPTVVLGSVAAARLGIGAPGPRLWLGDHWFTVAGILAPVPLAPEIDRAALVGWPVAQSLLAFDGHPTTLYSRSREDRVEAVRNVLAATANPAAPNEVQVSRPSDALAAQRAAGAAFTGLLLGLGAVSLLVGGVGVANTMVISVLERRPEIGLRRALGATRGHVRAQFFAESLLLSALGGLGGVLLGVAVTASYATVRDWPAVVPPWATAGAIGATLVIGAIAGLYPAIRAARLSPTTALSSF